MTAEEYFRNHWQQANRERFGDYGDYDSDEYAIAFAEDYARYKFVSMIDKMKELDWVEADNGFDIRVFDRLNCI